MNKSNFSLAKYFVLGVIVASIFFLRDSIARWLLPRSEYNINWKVTNYALRAVREIKCQDSVDNSLPISFRVYNVFANDERYREMFYPLFVNDTEKCVVDKYGNQIRYVYVNSELAMVGSAGRNGEWEYGHGDDIAIDLLHLKEEGK